MTKIIGLTGGIACGKSTVTQVLVEKGYPIIDADNIARQVVKPGKQALKDIEQRFGGNIINSEGGLNRIKLRKIIFQDKVERQWLEDLLHPLIRQEIKAQAMCSTVEVCIIDIPLLKSREDYPYLDEVWVVDVDPETQIERLVQRDNLSHAQAKAVIGSQISRKQRLALADWVIDNSGTAEDLKSALHCLTPPA